MTDEEKKQMVELYKQGQREVIEEEKDKAMMTFVQHEIFDRHFAELHKAKIKRAKAVKLFNAYFVDRYANSLPDICKTIFQANNSQKDYAIMICLLQDKFLLSFKRAQLFKAWYNFIGRSFAPKENFQAINKYFLDTAPACSFDESDPSYKDLKKQFEKALKDNSIR